MKKIYWSLHSNVFWCNYHCYFCTLAMVPKKWLICRTNNIKGVRRLYSSQPIQLWWFRVVTVLSTLFQKCRKRPKFDRFKRGKKLSLRANQPHEDVFWVQMNRFIEKYSLKQNFYFYCIVIIDMFHVFSPTLDTIPEFWISWGSPTTPW